MTKSPQFKHLSVAESLRALYVDFEGDATNPPVLLGVHRHTGAGPKPFVAQQLVDPVFAPLGLPTGDLHTAITNLVMRAEKDRRIVAWSERELDVVRDLGDAGLQARFEARFLNARSLAERWRHRCHDGALPPTNRLRDYLDLVGYRVPAEAPYGETARTVRAIRDRLERGAAPTEGQLARWARVLEHNRYDCAGMRRVCLLAAREMEADTP